MELHEAPEWPRPMAYGLGVSEDARHENPGKAIALVKETIAVRNLCTPRSNGVASYDNANREGFRKGRRADPPSLER